MAYWERLKNYCRAGLLVGLLIGARPATAQSAESQALTLAVRQHANQRAFDRATLPLYRRALRLSQQVPRDTLLDFNAYCAGRCYLNLSRLDSALVLLQQSLQAAWLTHDTLQVTRSANVVVDIYGRQQLPDSVRAVVRRLQALYPHTRPGTAVRNNLDNALAGYYQDEGQYAEALGYCLAQLAFCRAQHNPGKAGVVLSNISELFYLQGQLRQSLNYRFAGLHALEQDSTRRRMLPQLHAMIGKNYRELGRLDSARWEYEMALKLLGNPTDNLGMVVYMHSELGGVLGQQGQFAPARAHCRQALAYCANSDDIDGQAKANYFAGDVEIKAHNYPAARAYLRRAYTLAQQGQSLDRLEPITRLLSLAEAQTGNYPEAYRLRDLSAVLLDSAHVTEGQQAMAAMEARYQNKDKQQQITLLNGENRLRAAEAASQRRAKYLAWAGVGGLLLVLGFIGYLLRQRQRTAALLATQNAALETLNQRLNGSNAQLAEANQTKTKLFSIISHDLRAPVGNLFQLLEIAEEAPDLLDPATQQQQTTHLRRTTGALLDTMDELLAWSKDQLDYLDPVPEAVPLAPALAELAALYQPLAQRKGLALIVECPPALTARTDPNFLRVVLRNLVQNAIKFTPAGGQVRLTAEAARPGLVLRVADTGPGLDARQLAQALGEGSDARPDPAHGLGLQLTREFVAKLGGVLRVEPAVGEGTVFVVELPG